MTETQLLSLALIIVSTMTVVLIGILINNSRLGDVKDLLKTEISSLRDVIRAEMEKNHSEMLHRFADLDTRMSRLENGLGMNRG